MAGPDEPIHLSAEEARQGERMLRKRWERVVFMIGLIGAVVLGIILLWR